MCVVTWEIPTHGEIMTFSFIANVETETTTVFFALKCCRFVNSQQFNVTAKSEKENISFRLNIRNGNWKTELMFTTRLKP